MYKDKAQQEVGRDSFIIKRILLKAIRQTAFGPLLEEFYIRRKQLRELREWERNGRPLPPPHLFKQRTLRHYAHQYQLKILVETGTYLGDMVKALHRTFEHVYSIELSSELHQKAGNRLKKLKNITLTQGDSGIVLKNILARLDKPALFWLDGHYSAGITARGSKESPIIEELEQIFRSGIDGYVVIIDDARCFTAGSAYPSIEELTQFVQSRNRSLQITVREDMIRLVPQQENIPNHDRLP